MAPKKVVLLACGSFNPPTFMHLRMFELARDYLHKTGNYQVVCGIISPVHDSYKKKDLISSTHRTALLKMTLRDSDWLYLSDWECNRLEYTPTRLVLQYHQNQITAAINHVENQNKRAADEPLWITHVSRCASPGNITVKLLCGADFLESFQTPNLWLESDVASIVKDHGIVVITRSGCANVFKFIYESDLLSQYQNNVTVVTEWVTNEISSTKVRRSLKRGESVKYLISNDAINYIKTQGLYGATTTKKCLHACSETPCIVHGM